MAATKEQEDQLRAYADRINAYGKAFDEYARILDSTPETRFPLGGAFGMCSMSNMGGPKREVLKTDYEKYIGRPWVTSETVKHVEVSKGIFKDVEIGFLVDLPLPNTREGMVARADILAQLLDGLNDDKSALETQIK